MFFVTPELRDVLRWNFCSVNGISLEIYLGFCHIPLQLLRLRLPEKTHSDFTNQLFDIIKNFQ